MQQPIFMQPMRMPMMYAQPAGGSIGIKILLSIMIVSLIFIIIYLVSQLFAKPQITTAVDCYANVSLDGKQYLSFISDTTNKITIGSEKNNITNYITMPFPPALKTPKDAVVLGTLITFDKATTIKTITIDTLSADLLGMSVTNYDTKPTVSSQSEYHEFNNADGSLIKTITLAKPITAKKLWLSHNIRDVYNTKILFRSITLA